MTLGSPPNAQSVPASMHRSQRIQSSAPAITGTAGGKPPERDITSRPWPSRAAWKQQLKGIEQDVKRLKAQSGPNAQDQISAVCRVLNDCNKWHRLLRSLFAGTLGDDKNRQDLRAGIRLAMELANKHLQAQTVQILRPWCICQLFNAVRGLLRCEPFAGTDLALAFRKDLAALATNLMLALAVSPAAGPAHDLPAERDDLLPYPVILLGVYRMCKAELIDPGAHLEVLRLLLDAISTSRDAEGWSVWAIANACFALGRLLETRPLLLGIPSLHASAATLAAVVCESLVDPSAQALWKERKAETRTGSPDEEAIEGLNKMLAAGIGVSPAGDIDPDFAQALQALEAILPGHADPRALRVEPARPAEPDDRSDIAELASASVAQIQLPGESPAPALPVEATVAHARSPASEDSSTIAKAHKRILDQLNAKVSRKALIRLIGRQSIEIIEALPHAESKDLSRWLTSIAKTEKSTPAGDRAVRALATAVQQHAQTRPRLTVNELVALLLALSETLRGFPACAQEVTAALQVLCQKLSKVPGKAIQLSAIWDAVRGMAPSLAQADNSAALALRHLTQLCKAGSPASQKAKFQYLGCLCPLVLALAPALDDPDVGAFLDRLALSVRKHKPSSTLAKTERALSLATIISNVSPASASNAPLLALLNALAAGLYEPPIDVTPERIGNAQLQRQLVYLLIKPFNSTWEDWSSIPETFFDNTLTSFIGGLIELDMHEPAALLGPERTILNAARAYFQVAVGKAQEISNAAPETVELFSRVVELVEYGIVWAFRSDHASKATALVAEAIAQSCMPLWRLGPDAYWHISSRIHAEHRTQHDDHLEILGVISAEDSYAPADEWVVDLLAFIKAGRPKHWKSPSLAMTGENSRTADGVTLEARSNTLASGAERALVAVRLLEDLARHLGQQTNLASVLQIGPWLRAALEHDTAGSVIQKLVLSLSKVVRGSVRLLESPSAMALIAKITCDALTVGRGEANEVIYSLMDVIARHCCRIPTGWENKWWANRKLDTDHGRGIFVFNILQKYWKAPKGSNFPNCYIIPLDADDRLTMAFAYGEAMDDLGHPWMNINATKTDQLALVLLHRYQAFRVRRARRNTDESRVKVLALAVHITALGPMHKDVHPLMPEIINVFQEIVFEWGNPIALIAAVPQQQRELLAIAAFDAQQAANRHADDQRHAAAVALYSHCKQFLPGIGK